MHGVVGDHFCLNCGLRRLNSLLKQKAEGSRGQISIPEIRPMHAFASCDYILSSLYMHGKIFIHSLQLRIKTKQLSKPSKQRYNYSQYRRLSCLSATVSPIPAVSIKTARSGAKRSGSHYTIGYLSLITKIAQRAPFLQSIHYRGVDIV